MRCLVADEVVVEFHSGIVENARWCPSCNFSTAVVVPVLAVDAQTLRIGARWRQCICRFCEKVWIAESGDTA